MNAEQNLLPGSNSPKPGVESNSTLNAKGADAFKSTTNSLVDFFACCSKNPDMDLTSFRSLVTDMHSSLHKSPSAFLKLVKFQRNIKGGNGIRQYLLIGFAILKSCSSPELYKEVLQYWYQYAKDLHQISKLTEDLSTSETNSESIVYATKVFEQLIKLLKGEKADDLMIFKYLAHENGKWKTQTDAIWIRVNEMLLADAELESLLTSETPLQITPLGETVRSLLEGQLGKSPYITRRVARKLKTAVDSTLNLTDYLWAGVHYSGKPFDFSEAAWETEVELIASEISKSSGLATTRLCNSLGKKLLPTIEKAEAAEEVITPIRKLLKGGYEKYREKLANKEIVAKEVGQDLSQLVFDYFESGINMTGLESQLETRIQRIKDQIMPMFCESFNLEQFMESFVIIMDRSGSMDGMPLYSGLLQMLIMAKIFRCKKIVYFDSSVEVKLLTNADIDGPILDLVMKVYTRTSGSTVLQYALEYLESIGASNKNVVIITDSDCDPHQSFGASPFHEAFNETRFKHLPKNRYIVLNVKETKMSFPYLDYHPHVSYISGVSCLDFLIQALVRSSRDYTPLTPQLVLECCLEAERFALPERIEELLLQQGNLILKPLDEFPMEMIHDKWIQMFPKKLEPPVPSMDEDSKFEDSEFEDN